MNLPEFEGSLVNSRPPAGLSSALLALWWAGKGAWDKAHKVVMDQGGKDCAWVHAYLHRLKGDLDNARYWYRRAGRGPSQAACDAEWKGIARSLLDAS